MAPPLATAILGGQSNFLKLGYYNLEKWFLCFGGNPVLRKHFHSFFALVETVHQYGTRQASMNDIFITQKNTLQYGLRSVRYFGAKCWNNLPMVIKSSQSAYSFRQKLKYFFFENNYQS